MSPAPRWVPPARASSGPLAGVRVVDLSAFAVGPWAASLLASLGADVLKIDPPYGDQIRRVKPSRHGEATTYTVCNLGKRSIELDLKDPDQLTVAHQLITECDVVLENSREGAMDRLGLGYQRLRELNPRLVYCASSSFGSTGPLATVGSTDPQGQAFSGFVSIQGDAGAAPEFLRYFAAVDLGTSACLVQAVLAGLLWRGRTGVGCVLKTSQLEGALALQSTKLAEHLVAGATPTPMGSATTTFVPSEEFRCRDTQYLAVSAPDERSWRRLCAALGQPELAGDPRFAGNRERVANRDELVALLRAAFAERDAAWWRGRLRVHRVPHAVGLALDDLLRGTGPALTAEFLTELAHPVRGRHRTVRPPWRFSRTPAAHNPAPVPGQHNTEFLGAPGGGIPPTRSERRVDAGPGGGAEGQPGAADHRSGAEDRDVVLPLSGMRVVELAQGVAGPYCGMLLRALGAEVTKIEPSGGDYARGWAPLDRRTGESAVFSALNRGKSGGRADRVAEQLGAADVIIVDAEDTDGALLSRTGRGAVLLRLSATGPEPAGLTDDGWGGRNRVNPATELEVQALAGLTRYLGTIGAAPVRVGADLAFTLAGAFGLQGVLAALLERQRSGRGQVVEVSALGALMSIMTVMVAALDDPNEWAGFHCLAAGYPRDHGVPTADGAISFSAPRRSDEAWYALCHELGADALARDERYLRNEQRVPKAKELNRDLAGYTANLPTDQVLAATHRHGGLAVAVQRYPEVFNHPQVAAMDVCDTGGGYRSLAAPWRLNGQRPHITGEAPQLENPEVVVEVGDR